QSNPIYAINPKTPPTVSASITLPGNVPTVLASPSPATLLVPDSATPVGKGPAAKNRKKPGVQTGSDKSTAATEQLTTNASELKDSSSAAASISAAPKSNR